MTLKITELNLKNFRSYSAFQLSDIGDLTIFVGPNAAGKTNIAEAIGLLTSLTSFRHAMARDIIKQGEDIGKISAEITDGNRQLTIEMSIENNHKSYLLNGKSKRTNELKGLIPSVSFSPDDLNLVKGSNTQRRRTLDILGSQLNANYYQIFRDYEKVLKHKNKLLKDEAPIDLLETIDELVIKVGAQLTAYRQALFYKLMVHMRELYTEITGASEILKGEYIPSWVTESVIRSLSNEKLVIEDQVSYEVVLPEHASTKMEQALSTLRQQEASRKRTLIGPQRDEIRFTLDGLDASTYASQGQQRSIVLAWKLAEAKLVEEMTDQLPVLILDDVMSELDETRRSALVKYLSEDIQTFITTANIDYFDESMIQRARVVQIG